MPKQRTVKDVLTLLKAEGFEMARQTGSHQRWIHKDDPTRFATISVHSKSQTFPVGTLKSIEKTTGINF